eukprot:6460147-Pyramimonas_sp.AAC.1
MESATGNHNRLTAREVLETLGAHPEIVGRVCEPRDCPWWLDVDDNVDEDEWDDSEESGPPLFGKASVTREIHAFLSQSHDEHDCPPLVFYAGSDKLNPVPLFVLSTLAPNLVGGWISALVHT